MADALVSMVMEKLREEVTLVGGANAELEKLSSTFKSIQAVLNHAETMQITDESVRDWLEKLKDVAYDMDDILDELILSAESRSETSSSNDRRIRNQVWACLFSLFSCFGLEDWMMVAHESWDDGTDDGGIGDKVRTFFNQVKSRGSVAHQIKEMKVRLDQIANEKNKYRFKENYSFCRGNELDRAEFQTSSLVDESQMLGRGEDKDIIISQLVSGSSCELGRIHVISIVGIGGLGKTTLARLIFKDDRVRSHFDQFLWVFVSDDFDVKRLTKEIIEEAGGVNPLLSQLNPLQNMLVQTLQGKRFLLVLDDVWNDDSERWEKLRLSFESGAPGSKILVTTRSQKVARAMDAAYIHELKGLSDDDCWLLFSSRAFAGREMENRLKEIGKEIVKKCKGVPLSAKVIGSAMRSKRTAQDWQDILESKTWEIPEAVKGILPALLLSYYNLPMNLKQCFAYCSIFPKDHPLEKDILVKLWLAQGFIKSQGRREMEAIGEEYFDDLVERSLLQYMGERSCFIMHDLLHDLAQFITKNECSIIENGKSDSNFVTARHSSFIVTWETPHIPATLCKAKGLRTLIHFSDSVRKYSLPLDLFDHARSLRTLDLGGCSDIKELPSSIGFLKHLRYLDLSWSHIVELPESVSRLCNLQTLKLNYCRNLQRLPSGMSAMVRLRHLEIDNTWELKYLPEALGRISSLRTLSRFIVGGNGGCKIGQLKQLNSLQGKLRIINLERVGSGDEAKEAELEKKLHLRVLSLEMSRDGEVERMDSVLEALRPPHINLEELEIWSYIGSKFPTWMGNSSFSNLVKLSLNGCSNCTQLPGLGRLPSLEYLEIARCHIKRVGQEFYGNSCGGGVNGAAFPKLEELNFSYMNGLEEWELKLEDREIMPSLRKLQVAKCPKLKALPKQLLITLTSLKIVECFQISGMPCFLPLLEHFEVDDSGGIFSGPLPYLPSLKRFSISNLENATSLPSGWEQLKLLESLSISCCYKLRSLPYELGQLKSLSIHHCPELLLLPQWWGDLAGLGNLKNLEINNSPALKEICKTRDWSKISHIPNIWIDGRTTPGLMVEQRNEVPKMTRSIKQTRLKKKRRQPGTMIKDEITFGV